MCTVWCSSTGNACREGRFDFASSSLVQGPGISRDSPIWAGLGFCYRNTPLVQCTVYFTNLWQYSHIFIPGLGRWWPSPSSIELPTTINTPIPFQLLKISFTWIIISSNLHHHGYFQDRIRLVASLQARPSHLTGKLPKNLIPIRSIDLTRSLRVALSTTSHVIHSYFGFCHTGWRACVSHLL